MLRVVLQQPSEFRAGFAARPRFATMDGRQTTSSCFRALFRSANGSKSASESFADRQEARKVRRSLLRTGKRLKKCARVLCRPANGSNTAFGPFAARKKT